MNQDLSMYHPAAFSIIYGLENTKCGWDGEKANFSIGDNTVGFRPRKGAGSSQPYRKALPAVKPESPQCRGTRTTQANHPRSKCGKHSG